MVQPPGARVTFAEAARICHDPLRLVREELLARRKELFKYPIPGTPEQAKAAMRDCFAALDSDTFPSEQTTTQATASAPATTTTKQQ